MGFKSSDMGHVHFLNSTCAKLKKISDRGMRHCHFLKERSRPSVSNVTPADVMLATTGSRGRHWLTSRIPSKNVTDHTPEMIQ